MTRRQLVGAFVAAVVALAVTAPAVLAHEVTYLGTVQSVGADRVQVQTVADDGTEAEMIAFTVTPDTKVQRGETPVMFSAAGIQMGERIAVVVDHDVDETVAIEIRLAAR